MANEQLLALAEKWEASITGLTVPYSPYSKGYNDARRHHAEELRNLAAALASQGAEPVTHYESIYAFLCSVAPEGIADEAFRNVPEALLANSVRDRLAAAESTQRTDARAVPELSGPHRAPRVGHGTLVAKPASETAAGAVTVRVNPTVPHEPRFYGDAPAVTDAMVSAYLDAQRAAVEEADKFGRPNIGGLHTNTVREACRAGITAALAATPPAATKVPNLDLSQWEKARFGVFLEDGRFEELPPSDPCGEKHPRGHTSRWVGGVNDMQLLRAVLRPPAAAPPASVEAAPKAPAVPEMLTFDQWWLALPEGRRDALREDKWMLAEAAYDAARTQSAPPAAQQIGVVDKQGRADE